MLATLEQTGEDQISLTDPDSRAMASGIPSFLIGLVWPAANDRPDLLSKHVRSLADIFRMHPSHNGKAFTSTRFKGIGR
ncbi:MAG: hypothetical protein JOY63_01500 [Acetobacteraceae bacterium]|nr:hypothetical protein [Acetobacteraceae bacterium]